MNARHMLLDNGRTLVVFNERAPRCETTGAEAIIHKGWWLCPSPSTRVDARLRGVDHEYGHAISSADNVGRR